MSLFKNNFKKFSKLKSERKSRRSNSRKGINFYIKFEMYLCHLNKKFKIN